MLTAQSLNGFPDLEWRDGHDRGMVGFRRHVCDLSSRRAGGVRDSVPLRAGGGKDWRAALTQGLQPFGDVIRKEAKHF